jgi:hypothetical protein
METHYAEWLKKELREIWEYIQKLEKALESHGVKLEEVKA